jgi:small subunit ribosomal protein S20
MLCKSINSCWALFFTPPSFTKEQLCGIVRQVMPIIKSAIKRARQAEKRRSHNLVVKHAVKKDIKAVMTALDAKDAKSVEATLRAAVSEIDRAVKKGALHINTAARKKSRLTKHAARVLAEDDKPKVARKPAAKAASKKTPAKKASPSKTKKAAS